MKKILIASIFMGLLTNCGGSHENDSVHNKPIIKNVDSIKKRKATDAQMAMGNRPDSEQEGPTFKEVLAELLKSYNKIEKIDKMVIDGKDTLQLHETYYCLHDSSLIVPRHYLWGGDTTRDFIANTFATKIIVINNRDTVLNKVFKRADFNSTLWDRLRQYAIIFTADYIGYDKAKHEFALGYSITIPLTDVGVPASIVVDKKGNYKILNEYAKMDDFKKD